MKSPFRKMSKKPITGATAYKIFLIHNPASVFIITVVKQNLVLLALKFTEMDNGFASDYIFTRSFYNFYFNFFKLGSGEISFGVCDRRRHFQK